jgi:hypothetical protein
LEQRDDGERRDRDRDAVARGDRSEDRLEDRDADDVRAEQDDGERRVNKGAADDHVDVVQAIAHDRDTDRDRDHSDPEQRRGIGEVHDGSSGTDDEGQQQPERDGCRVHQPLQLLSHDIGAATEPDNERDRRDEHYLGDGVEHGGRE